MIDLGLHSFLKVPLKVIKYVWNQIRVLHVSLQKNPFTWHVNPRIMPHRKIPFMELENTQFWSSIHVCFVFNWAGVKPRRSPNRGVISSQAPSCSHGWLTCRPAPICTLNLVQSTSTDPYPLLISTDFLKYPFRQLFQTGIKFQL